MRATKGLLKGLNPTMAMTALTVVTLFLLFGVFDPDTAGTWFTGAKDTIIAGFKWYYILVVALFLFFAVYLMFSRFGSIRLGDDDQVPEFGYFAWFSMLFSAGMGIGLVAEMATREGLPQELVARPCGHLFGRSVTRIALKRGAWLRHFVYRLAELVSDRLTRELVERAMSGQAEDYGL